MADRMTLAEFRALVFPCPECGSVINVGTLDVTCVGDPEPMVMLGRAECTQPGCKHGPPLTRENDRG